MTAAVSESVPATSTATSTEPSGRHSAAEELKAVALRLFAVHGYAGTSLQQIAEAAGYAKSNVLYHFSSKEELLDAALAPAVDEVERVLLGDAGLRLARGEHRAFAEAFVDVILRHRFAVHLFISQGLSLEQLPVVARATAVIRGMVASPFFADSPLQSRLRLAVALGGAAYSLVAGIRWLDDELPLEGLRVELVALIAELLAGSTPAPPPRP